MKTINPNVLANIEDLPTILSNDPNLLEDLEANLENLYDSAFSAGYDDYSNKHKKSDVQEYFHSIKDVIRLALENLLYSE